MSDETNGVLLDEERKMSSHQFDEVAPLRSGESENEEPACSRRADSGRDLSPQMSLKENGSNNSRLTLPSSV